MIGISYSRNDNNSRKISCWKVADSLVCFCSIRSEIITVERCTLYVSENITLFGTGFFVLRSKKGKHRVIELELGSFFKVGLLPV